MKTFFAVVHKDDDSAFGVTFPDLPGCFSAADDMADLVPQAAQALELWFEDAAPVEPSPLSEIRTAHAADLESGAFIIAVPWLQVDARPVRVNVSLDRGTLAAIDASAAAMGLTRSAFLTQAARKEIVGAH